MTQRGESGTTVLLIAAGAGTSPFHRRQHRQLALVETHFLCDTEREPQIVLQTTFFLWHETAAGCNRGDCEELNFAGQTEIVVC